MNAKSILPLAGLVLAYIYIGYFLDRSDFYALLVAFSSAFALQGYMLHSKTLTHQQLWYWSIAVRILLLLSIPALSDDYFRFIWDGRLMASGINPFDALPSFYLTPEAPRVEGIDLALFEKLNSPNYFTIYPPVCQAVFWLSAKLAMPNILGQVIVMRFCILFADLWAIKGLERLMKHYGLPLNNLWLYALNPLVIVELTGNLHFEAFMIAGLIWALYFLLKEKWLQSALWMLVAVNAKLIPLMLLPSILAALGWKKSIGYYLIVGIGTLLAFIPFIDMDMLIHLGKSINLYFQSFEFNASIYYIIRWVGYEVMGYNIIQKAGPWLSVAVLAGILFISWWLPYANKESITKRWVWIFVIYLLGATVVHPWYILVLVVLTSLTKYRFALIWSMLILLSYNAYQSETYHENLVLVIVEYSVFIAWLLWELFAPLLLKKT